MLQDTLQAFGLNEKETIVYMTLLKRGAQPASIIARTSLLPRNTARFCLDSLVSKGLVTKNYKGNMQIYTPEKTQTLITLLEAKKQRLVNDIEQKQKSIKQILPEFESYFSDNSAMPKVKFFEGVDNLKTLYEDTLTSKTPIVCYSSVDDLLDVFGEDYMEWYTEEKAKRGIFLESLALETKRTIEYVQANKKKKRDMFLIPSDKYPFSDEINIYDNKVSIIALKDLVGVLIESKDIYLSQVTIFRLAQTAAKSFKKHYN